MAVAKILPEIGNVHSCVEIIPVKILFFLKKIRTMATRSLGNVAINDVIRVELIADIHDNFTNNLISSLKFHEPNILR